jgi:ATP-dependent protease ClpP protease subunit
VTELIVAQLMYLEWMNSKEPVYIYINSTGTARDDGEPVSKIVQLVTSVKYFQYWGQYR